MKPKSAAALLTALPLCFFAACAEDVPVPEVSEVSYAVLEESTAESLKTTASSYLAALAAHDHTAVTMYTTDDFVMNYDETGFYDYCGSITGFTLTEADTDHVTFDGGVYRLPVTYTLSFDSPFTDESGAEQNSGDYTYNKYMHMTETDEGMKLSDITERAMG